MSEKKYLLIALFGFLAGAWLVTLPAGLHPGRLLLTSDVLPAGLPLQDQAFFLFSLWWTPAALFSYHTHPWFTHLMGAPEGVSLLYSSIVPMLGLMSYPFSFFLNGIAIYNCWVVVSIVLTAFFTMLVARELGASRSGALLAGVILFYPFIYQSQLGHLNVISAYWIPLGYFCYLRFCRSNALRWGVLTAAVWGMCFYVCTYQTIHLSLLLGLDLMWRLWKTRSGFLMQPGKRLLRLFWVFILAGMILLSFWPMGASYALIATILAALVVLVAGAWNRPGAALVRRNAAVGFLVVLLFVLPFFLARGFDTRLAEGSPKMSLPVKIYWSAQPALYVLSPRIANYLVERGYFGGRDMLHLDPSGEFQNFPGYAVWALFLAVLVFGRWAWRRGGCGGGSGEDGEGDAPTPLKTGGLSGLAGRNASNARWLALAGIFALLSFGPVLRWGTEWRLNWLALDFIYLPGVAFHFLPLLDGYRAYTRLGFLVLFCVAIFVGLGWSGVCNAVSDLLRAWGTGESRANTSENKDTRDSRDTKDNSDANRLAGKAHLKNRYGPCAEVALTFVFCVLVLLERISVPAEVQEIRVPTIYEKIARMPADTIIYEFPSNSGQYLYPLTRHRRPLANYYLSRVDLGQERKREENAFIAWMSSYGDMEGPASVRGKRGWEAIDILEGFKQSGIQVVILHRPYLRQAHAEYIEGILKGLLGMKMVDREGGIAVFSRQLSVSSDQKH